MEQTYTSIIRCANPVKSSRLQAPKTYPIQVAHISSPQPGKHSSKPKRHALLPKRSNLPGTSLAKPCEVAPARPRCWPRPRPGATPCPFNNHDTPTQTSHVKDPNHCLWVLFKCGNNEMTVQTAGLNCYLCSRHAPGNNNLQTRCKTSQVRWPSCTHQSLEVWFARISQVKQLPKKQETIENLPEPARQHCLKSLR